MKFDICAVFYVVSYEVIKAKEQEKQFKQMQHGNKR